MALHLPGAWVMCLLKVGSRSPDRLCPFLGLCPVPPSFLLLPSILQSLGANGFASMRAEIVLSYCIPVVIKLEKIYQTLLLVFVAEKQKAREARNSQSPHPIH